MRAAIYLEEQLSLQKLFLLIPESGKTGELRKRGVWMLTNITEKEDCAHRTHFTCIQRDAGLAKRKVASNRPWRWSKDRAQIFMDWLGRHRTVRASQQHAGVGSDWGPGGPCTWLPFLLLCHHPCPLELDTNLE